MGQQTLKICRDVELPIDVITEKVAVLAMSGAGKTYLAGTIVEKMLDARAQVVIVDPPGAWWGLGSSADGKEAGYPVVVMGGRHQHIPLDPKGGRLVAQFIAKNRGTSVVLDLVEFTLSQQAHFMSEYADEIWKVQVLDPQPLHHVLEEAHSLVPQELPREAKEAAVMLGRMRRLVKQGRNYGFGFTMISQEPQSIDKRCLNLSSILFVMRIMGDLERKAIERWFGDNARTKHDVEIVKDLQTLSTGEAVMCSPQLLGKYAKVSGWKKWTFDSSATPKFGKQVAQPNVAAQVDIEALRIAMGEMVSSAEADDPRVLQRRVTELERELKARPTVVSPEARPKAISVKVPALDAKEAARIERLISRAEVLVAKFIPPAMADTMGAIRLTRDALEAAKIAAFKAEAAVRGDGYAIAPVNVVQPPTYMKDKGGFVTLHGRPSDRTFLPAEARPAKHAPPVDGVALKPGQRKVLIAVAQNTAGVRKSELNILAGYRRSTRDRLLQELKALRCVEENGDLVVATETGVSMLGTDYEPLPTGSALREHWLGKLKPGQKTVLEFLIGRFPNAVDKAVLNKESVGYELSTRNRLLQELKAMRLVEEPGRSSVRASPTLFDSAAA